MAIMLAVIVLGFLGMTRLSTEMMDNTGWTEDLKNELAGVEAELASPDLTEEEREQLEMEKQGLEESIVYSIEAGEPEVRESVITEGYGITALVTLLTIIAASGIVATEFSQGTIKMLLSRPVKRWKVLASKYAAVLLFCLLLTTLTFVMTVIGAFLFFPGSTESTFMFYHIELTTTSFWGMALYLMFLAFINSAVVATLAFAIGTIFRSTSLAIGISLFLYFTGLLVVMFLEKYGIGKYVLFANTNLTNYVTDSPLLSGMTMPFSIVMLVVYVAIFLGFSFWSFTKRDVAA